MSSVTSRAPRPIRKAASVDLPAPLGPSNATAPPSSASTVACKGSSPCWVSAVLSTKFSRLASNEALVGLGRTGAIDRAAVGGDNRLEDALDLHVDRAITQGGMPYPVLGIDLEALDARLEMLGRHQPQPDRCLGPHVRRLSDGSERKITFEGEAIDQTPVRAPSGESAALLRRLGNCVQLRLLSRGTKSMIRIDCTQISRKPFGRGPDRQRAGPAGL